VALTWVTIAQAGQGLANNVSVVLGCIATLLMSVSHGLSWVGRGGDSRWTLLESPTFGYVV
jgi:hypothetical protein